MEILLSVCVPTYNRLALLKKQVEFFEREGVFDNRNIEIIFSDNASTDGTRDYLKALKRRSDTIKVLFQNRNIGLIRNLLSIQPYICGKYLWYIGDDDIIKSGLLKEVISILQNDRQISHIFINHSFSEYGKVVKEKCYDGEGGAYEDALFMFMHIVKHSSVGVQMFLTANIYLTEKVLEANEILEKYDEQDNMALPLGYSLASSHQRGYIIDAPMIVDEVGGISWKDKMVLVWCRDIYAVCDVISGKMGFQNEVMDLLMKYQPRKYPEIFFGVFGKRYNKENYVLNLMKGRYKKKLFFDLITFPGFATLRICRKMIKRLKLY